MVSFFRLAEHVAETLDIGPGTRVFEVDCGDGEFLLPLHQNGYIVGGIDADPEAIEKRWRPCRMASSRSESPRRSIPRVPWHVVVCRSFAGAPDTDYIRGVLARMFAKATHAIALLDVPDSAASGCCTRSPRSARTRFKWKMRTRVSNSRNRFNVFARV